MLKENLLLPENCRKLFETPYIKVFDLQYGINKHYYNATRRSCDELPAYMDEITFKESLPDAVTCAVILLHNHFEPQLLLSYEYRYPIGRYLLSPPAGLIDKQDAQLENPIIAAAIREINEETGILVKETDDIHIVSPMLFSSPGMTDESNAVVCAVVQLDSFDTLTQAGAVGSERFNGFLLVTQDEAKEILCKGTDPYGITYSTYTWIVLSYFCSGEWMKRGDET